MTDTRDHLRHPKVFSTDSMKLTSSASEQNVYFTYVCLVNDIKPSGTLNPIYGYNNKPSLNLLEVSSAHNQERNLEDMQPERSPIQVERSKALHELVESYKKAEQGERNETDSSTPYPTTTSGEDSELSENDENNFISCDNPNVLKLTKMKWLTEDQDDGPDSSSPSLSPATSSSICSKVSEDDLKEDSGIEDKYLSTILRLDKEHNMFGLSNIAIVGSKPSKPQRKDEERAVFHQTAIVQICSAKGNCCKHKSNSDLPTSLKCGGGCRGCCVDPYCSVCAGPCGTPCGGSCGTPCVVESPCTPFCTSCPRGRCSCKLPCPPIKCTVDCNTCFGLKIKLNRKPKYEPTPIELTPRSSCVLQKPMAARSCHHLPQCIPPSSCFPYLMPCFWPARPSAPCSSPTRCFHNPPCPAARKPARVPIPKEYICPKKCVDEEKKTKCENDICPGNNPVLKAAIEKRFGASST
ncbi:uncharacterized protein LOC113495755 isoform X1 [Trichoplusia ni]|uniref:Uncharacterized protein LOC113495755 isoform X1 n=1 Tax=Trichoplusia ni TaxID=7111 RepID=A0A7E5VQM9_TRINI|nr:uncharacterized protein LOC113495755 isoform X1 [Trichoplusia ni]